VSRRRVNPEEVAFPRDFDEAVDGYTTFHTGPGAPMGKREPRQVGQLPGFRWPERCTIVGRAKHVMYRSDKWESRKYDYIHEHEHGVVVARFDEESAPHHDKVPGFICDASTIYLLGECLGFAYETDDGEEIEARTPRKDLKNIELYAIPSNRALIVLDVSGRTARVEAMVWGGGLNVIDRGIIG
jgi:hypothetical protein